MNWENQSEAECASGMDAALAAEKTQLPPVRSEPLFDGKHTLADIRAMLYDPDAETPWADMLPSFQRLLVEWLFSQLESQTSNIAISVKTDSKDKEPHP